MTDLTDPQEVEALCKLAEERDCNGVSFNANGIAFAAMLRRLLAERDAAFTAGAEAMREAAISACHTTYAIDAFHYELGTACAGAIRCHTQPLRAARMTGPSPLKPARYPTRKHRAPARRPRK